MHPLRAFFELARPHHYVKNGFVWLPLFFGNKLWDATAVLHTLWVFLAFCLAASCIYGLNDIRDAEDDRRHPVKCTRPVASGALSKAQAAAFMIGAGAAACGLALALLPMGIFPILASYLVLNVAYSFGLKHFAIVDVVCIAMGFVLRVLAGGLAADVKMSQWIIAVTFLFALFLAFAKRRDDLLLAANGGKIRKSLDGYSLELISLSMGIMASVIIVMYVLYTVSPEVIQKHGTDRLYLTGFWVVLGILRYLQVTFVDGKSGSPTLVLLKDRFLWVVVAGWILSCYAVIYGFGH